MDRDKPLSDQAGDEPEDGTVIRQVPWAWFYSSMPWIFVLFVLDQVLGLLGGDPFITLLITAIIVVPRYLTWRRTRYTLTKETLIYQRGGITGSRSYSIPLSNLKDVRGRFGFFGRAMGYQAVDIVLDNGAIVTLPYVPALERYAERIRDRMGAPDSRPEGSQEAEEPAEEPPPSDPGEPEGRRDSATDDPK